MSLGLALAELLAGCVVHLIDQTGVQACKVSFLGLHVEIYSTLDFEHWWVEEACTATDILWLSG